MHGDSVLYTVGTALNRARDSDVAVEVLVEGQWLRGRVAAVDGHGVVLHADEAGGQSEHAVVRIGSVSAVRVFAEGPHHRPITSGARPMPAA